MTAAADRHLLFGLLALQNGLIDQGALLAAFQAWNLDKSRSLADHLEARGDLTGPKRAALEALAAVHVEAHGGDVEKSLAAVPANRSTRAGLVALGEPEIEATLARVTRNHDGPATEADDDPDRTSTLSVGAATGDGQRFRVLRPHARGGLGAVFVALDAELHREVALKQILEKHADDPVSRQRFVAEAEITGGLEHPGVVPVYGLGTYGGGRPYYAMRFIKGDSLKEAIEHFHRDESLKSNLGRRSLELRKLLRRFLDVCNAVDYAHSRGVIHRDLKPANIILGKHGETLVVDWGLAKVVGRADPSVGEQTIAAASSGSSETLPGSALGTPAYMSPEQARGDLDRLGPRSDVYSLGATLYCLLTGRPPFEGEDVGETLRRVQAGDFRAPREVDPSLDRALDAVCTKAMAMKPEDRYASGRALAEDIERWAADEPVTAYREPVSRRARRWAKRNRTIVATAAVALVVGVVGLSAVLVVQTRAKADIERALVRETQARAALAEANTQVQARYELAEKAIKTFHTGVSEDMLLKNEQFTALRTKLLKEAAGFYADLEKLLAGQTDARSRKALAAAYSQLGDLIDNIGSKPEALAVHRKALALRRELAAVGGADVEARLEVARSLWALGYLLLRNGDTAEALPPFQEQCDLAAALEAESPTDAVRVQLAVGYNGIGFVLQGMGKSAEALESFRKALAIYQKLPEAEQFQVSGQGPTFGLELQANAYSSIGWILSKTDKRAEGLESSRKGAGIMEKLAIAHPANTSVQQNLANNHNVLGILLRGAGRPDEAMEAYRKALTVIQKLADANPAVSTYQEMLAIFYGNLANSLRETGRPDEAMEAYRKALAIYQKLADANPTVTVYQARLAEAQCGIGRLLARQKRFAEAFAAIDAGLAILRKVNDAHPEDTQNTEVLGFSHACRGWALIRFGQPSQAAADLRRALELWAKVPNPDNETRVERSRALALLAGLGGDAKSGVTPAEARAFADQAVPALRDAMSAGWNRPDELKEPDFDALRGRDDFQKLVAEVEAKAGQRAKERD